MVSCESQKHFKNLVLHKHIYTQPKNQILEPILLDQSFKVPNFIEDINSRLLQEDIFHKSAWDGNLLSASLNQVFTDASFLHYTWAKVFRCIHHRLKECLQHSKQKLTSGTKIFISWKITVFFWCTVLSHF